MPQDLLSLPVIGGGALILSLWLLVLSILYVRSERRFRRLTRGVKEGDLRTILETIDKEHTLTKKEIAAVDRALQQTREEAKLHVQAVGFMRYNPFGDTGGDQSFCLSLLDGNSDGVVISSLHSRDQTRIYAKRLKNGKSPGYTLSKEERAVVINAQKQLTQ